MEKQTVRLLKKEEIADGTMMFAFEKPDGFVFKAGQSIDLTLINPEETDAEGNTRAFSLASAPYENYLEVATRLRDVAFKRVLKSMEAGTEASIDGPFGSFLLHSSVSKPAVFLVGGIGITPFYSMIKNSWHMKTGHKIFLFYSNRRPEDTAFLWNLQQMERENPDFRLICTMTDMEKSRMPWDGETGVISEEMIGKYLTDMKSPVYYSAGPPKMVNAMRNVLYDIGIDDDNIRTEEFSGY